MKNRVNLKDALMALDMVHADLWRRLETMKATNAKTQIINEMEVRALYLLVANAMIDCGHPTLKRAK